MTPELFSPLIHTHHDPKDAPSLIETTRKMAACTCQLGLGNYHREGGGRWFQKLSAPNVFLFPFHSKDGRMEDAFFYFILGIAAVVLAIKGKMAPNFSKSGV